MIKIYDTTPHVGGLYSSTDFTKFEITALPVIENEQWVEYINVKTNNTYNCLLEAFLVRFTPTV